VPEDAVVYNKDLVERRFTTSAIHIVAFQLTLELTPKHQQ
jgi:hypothetical protein